MNANTNTYENGWILGLPYHPFLKVGIEIPPNCPKQMYR
jgi:hypothetical protein